MDDDDILSFKKKQRLHLHALPTKKNKQVNYLNPTTKTKHTCVISPNHLIKNEALMHPTYINQILVLWVGAIWM